MIEIVKNIIINVLEALYQPFGFSVMITILFMFLYLDVKREGWKQVVQRWLDSFKGDATFRKILVLVFYTAMILFRTLLNRNRWLNALSNVIGVWGLYNENGDLTTEVIENLVLFIPFTIFMLWCFHEKIIGRNIKLWTVLYRSVMVVFIFSLTIEFLQLFLRLGTFQLSDLFYNTLGGAIGGLIYWAGCKIMQKYKK